MICFVLFVLVCYGGPIIFYVRIVYVGYGIFTLIERSELSFTVVDLKKKKNKLYNINQINRS